MPAPYPDEMKERAQELIDRGLTQREVAAKLQASSSRDGPTYTWVNTHTETPEGRGYERGERRSFEYPEGSGREVVLSGTHSIEACRAALKDYEDGAPTSVVAERYDLPRRTLEGLLDRAGVRRSHSEAMVNREIQRGRVSPIARRRQVERLYTEEKLSVRQIAERFEISKATVQADLDARGVEPRDKQTGMLIRIWGSLANYRRFCQRVAIMVRHRGETKKAACKEFDVCLETVNRALDHWDELKSRDKEHFWNKVGTPSSTRGGLAAQSFSPRRSSTS